jgi:twinkle protein
MNEDGSIKCFSCGAFIPNKNNIIAPISSRQSMDDGEYYALTDRGISLATAKKYGVKSIKNSKGKIVEHAYPYYSGCDKVGIKIRKPDKNFTWQGDSKTAGLFGQQLFQSGGKYITIVEGEVDAMSSFELMGSQWPVVSIRNGAQSADRDIKENLEFLESFDNIIINFDNDKVGEEAARKVAKLLRPGKAKIMSLPVDYKDANDMLLGSQHKAYVQCWWNSKLYTPSGVLNVSENVENYLTRTRKDSVPFPWEGLNEKLEGLRAGELVTLTGGTGLGKSSVTRELEHWLIKKTKDNVGVMALEENWQRTIDGILSIEADARLHLDSIRNLFDQDDLRQIHHQMFGGENKDRVWVYGHLGMNDLESVFSKLRYMIIGCDCKWIVLDHLHMLVLLSDDPDERKAIDMIMHRLRTLVEETGCGMILVSHLRRTQGDRGHENGIETALNHLRGSQSIAQLSDCVISLERNQQADDPIVASTTKVRVLKSRYTGDVGLATHLHYDSDSGRLSEVSVDDLQGLDGDEI